MFCSAGILWSVFCVYLEKRSFDGTFLWIMHEGMDVVVQVVHVIPSFMQKAARVRGPFQEKHHTLYPLLLASSFNTRKPGKYKRIWTDFFYLTKFCYWGINMQKQFDGKKHPPSNSARGSADEYTNMLPSFEKYTLLTQVIAVLNRFEYNQFEGPEV